MTPVTNLPKSELERSLIASRVQLFIASVVSFWGGFFTMDFLVSGVYTWPRASRVITLTLAIMILAYEFLYKDRRVRLPSQSDTQHLKVVFYSCLLPYMVGSLILLSLIHLL